MNCPPFLQKGDKVALVAPARKVSREELNFALDFIHEQGWEAVFDDDLLGHFHQWTDALEKVIASNHEAFFHEHVTNYLYNHPEQFQLQFLPSPVVLNPYPQIRMTIDTAGDFENAGKVYRAFVEGGLEFNAENTVKVLQQQEGLLLAMNKEIIANSK